jgi:hypothetical protein
MLCSRPALLNLGAALAVLPQPSRKNPSAQRSSNRLPVKSEVHVGCSTEWIVCRVQGRLRGRCEAIAALWVPQERSS